MSVSSRSSSVLAGLLALLAVLAGLLAGPAAATAGAAPRGLTGAQERVVLRLVDDVCGDTWCEGDHLFDFRSFSCDPAARSCLLRVRIAPLVDPGVPPSWRWRAGRVHGFDRFRDLVTTAPGGRQSLTPRFFLAVSALVTRLEATVPVVRPRSG